MEKCPGTLPLEVPYLYTVSYTHLENWEQKEQDIREYHVDTFVMGDDWKGKFDFLKPYCQVCLLYTSRCV